MEKMDGKTHNTINDNIQALMQIFPDAFSEGKVDYEKLQLLLGENIIDDKEKYSFTWKGKNDAIKVALAQNTGTLRPDKKSSKNWDTTQNLYLEGDNLEVLRTLQDSYRGKVKMIYIDPPYNTGNDYFIYPDNYGESIDNYKQKTEQDMKSNPDTSGRFHSDWLSMMYPRLKLARNLLKNDGVIFISIGDDEFGNLKKICDEIFGEENFLSDIIWNSTKSVTNTAIISGSHTHNLVYFKSMDYFTLNRNEFRLLEDGEGFNNPDNDTRGPWKADPFQVGGWRPNQQYEIKNPNTGEIYKPNTNCSWKNDYENFQNLLKDNRIVFGKTGEAGPQRKRFKSEALSRGKVAKTLWNNIETTTLWDDVETTTNGTQLLKNLFDNKYLFDNPKPIGLIERMLQLGTNSDSIILDFFSGSATTAHAIMKLNNDDKGNRKFILTQIPELTDEKSEAYIEGYKNICELGKERIRRAGEKILEENKDKEGIENLDVGFKVFKLDTTNLKKWEPSIKGGTDSEIKEQLQTRLTDMTNPVKEDREQIDMIYEIMLKNGMDLTLPMEELNILGKKVFSISSGYLIACLENNINLDVIKKICEIKPKVTVFYDNSFEDDVVKLNAIKLLEKQDNEGKQEIQVRVI